MWYFCLPEMVELKDQQGPAINRTVINPGLNRWLKSELRIRYLHEIARVTIGDLSFEPLSSTHIRITAPTQEVLADFMEQFPTRRQRLAPYQKQKSLS